MFLTNLDRYRRRRDQRVRRGLASRYPRDVGSTYRKRHCLRDGRRSHYDWQCKKEWPYTAERVGTAGIITSKSHQFFAVCPRHIRVLWQAERFLPWLAISEHYERSR